MAEVLNMRNFLFLLVLALFALPVYAEPDSLKGLETAKFVVDLNQGRASVLKTRLSLIIKTMDDIESSGVKPEVAVAVRGGASRFMTTHSRLVDAHDMEIKTEIESLLTKLKERGAKLEQCAIALGFMNISPSEINPALKVVPNGYVSLIGYQNRGFAILPME